MDANFILKQLELLQGSLDKEFSQDSSRPSDAFNQIARDGIRSLFEHLHPKLATLELPPLHVEEGEMDIDRVVGLVETFRLRVREAQEGEPEDFKATMRKGLTQLYRLSFPKGRIAQLQTHIEGLHAELLRVKTEKRAADQNLFEVATKLESTEGYLAGSERTLKEVQEELGAEIDRLKEKVNRLQVALERADANSERIDKGANDLASTFEEALVRLEETKGREEKLREMLDIYMRSDGIYRQTLERIAAALIELNGHIKKTGNQTLYRASVAILDLARPDPLGPEMGIPDEVPKEVRRLLDDAEEHGRAGTGPNGQAEKVCELSNDGYWIPRCPACLKFPQGDDPQQLKHTCKDIGFSGSVNEWYYHIALHVSCTYCGETPKRKGTRGVQHHCKHGGIQRETGARTWLEENWPGLAYLPFEHQDEIWRDNPEFEGEEAAVQPDDTPFLTQAHPTHRVLTYGDVWDKATTTRCKYCDGLPDYVDMQRSHGNFAHRCKGFEEPGVDFEGSAGEWLEEVEGQRVRDVEPDEEMVVVPGPDRSKPNLNNDQFPQGVEPRCPACNKEIEMEMKPYVTQVAGEEVRRAEIIFRHDNPATNCHFVGRPDEWIEFVEHYKEEMGEDRPEDDLFRAADLAYAAGQASDEHQETAKKVLLGPGKDTPVVNGGRASSMSEAFEAAYGSRPPRDGVVSPRLHFIRTETGRFSSDKENEAAKPSTRDSRATPIQTNLPPRRRKPKVVKVVGNIVVQDVVQKLVDNKEISQKVADKVKKGYADEVQRRLDVGKPHTKQEERTFLKKQPIIRDYVDEGGPGVRPLGRPKRFYGFQGDLPTEMIHKLREQLDALEKEVRGDHRHLNIRDALNKLEKELRTIKESQLSMMWKRIQWLEGKVEREGEGTWAALLEVMKRHGLRAPLALLRIYDMYDS